MEKVYPMKIERHGLSWCVKQNGTVVYQGSLDMCKLKVGKK
jgi:hypothetical protein